MEKIKIHNREVLNYQLQLLEAREKELRAKITNDAGAILHVLTDPATIIKTTIKKLAEDPEVRSDILNIVIKWVSNYIHGLFNKPGPVTDFLKRMIGKFSGRESSAS